MEYLKDEDVIYFASQFGVGNIGYFDDFDNDADALAVNSEELSDGVGVWNRLRLAMKIEQVRRAKTSKKRMRDEDTSKLEKLYQERIKQRKLQDEELAK